MQTGSSVELVSPHVLCYPKAGALVLDHCNMDHGIEVKATLTTCHGTVAACKDITTIKNGIVYGSDASIIHGIIDEGNKNKTGPTFINLSFNGGLQRATDYDFALLSQAEQDTFVSAYYWHMTNVLMSVAALKDEYRQNLVITIAAGNENFPMADMMDMLRQRPRIANILRDNVLVVSTERIPGIHANYAYDDADVVVLNNQSATSGSSLAAPCALGYMQEIVNRTGVTARQALKAMKDASWLLPDREVTLDNALAMLAGGHYVAGACVIKDTISGGANILQQVTYNVSSVDLLMRAPSGQMGGEDYGFCYLTVKAHVRVICISGCTGPASEGDVVMTQDSLEYHGNSLGGIASAPFYSSYAMVGLNGTRSGSTISGYLYLPFVNANNNRAYITLNKQ
ncbi:MAG TPA: hypothetical protein VK174_00790 [Chitinophagales bacterium]|nr:hypothetical protein [Chitinophagales bacterium]